MSIADGALISSSLSAAAVPGKVRINTVNVSKIAVILFKSSTPVPDIFP